MLEVTSPEVQLKAIAHAIECIKRRDSMISMLETAIHTAADLAATKNARITDLEIALTQARAAIHRGSSRDATQLITAALAVPTVPTQG